MLWRRWDRGRLCAARLLWLVAAHCGSLLGRLPIARTAVTEVWLRPAAALLRTAAGSAVCLRPVAACCVPLRLAALRRDRRSAARRRRRRRRAGPRPGTGWGGGSEREGWGGGREGGREGWREQEGLGVGGCRDNDRARDARSTRTHAHAHVHARARARPRMHARTRARAHTHTHTHTHTDADVAAIRCAYHILYCTAHLIALLIVLRIAIMQAVSGPLHKH